MKSHSGKGKVVRRVLIGAGIVVAGLLAVVAAIVGLYLYVTRPVSSGEKLASGAITAVVTGHSGPIAAVAYVFDLADGSLGLVDTGIDPAAANIKTVVSDLGKTAPSVRAVFITHRHSDHAGALLAFPEAVVYGLSPDVDALRQRRERAGATGETKSVKSGERLDVHGTSVEVFGLPGHTPGSAAYVVHGVLFLGDAAHSLRDGTFGTNEMFSEDGAANTRSVRSLIEQLRPRADIRQVAFGHSGPLTGLGALLTWASAK